MMKRLIRRIRNIVRWLPVLWEDEPWGYHFLLIVLRHKIATMLEYWESGKPRSIDAGKHIQQMERVLAAIDRVVKDDYLNSAEFQAHEEKWGPADMIWQGLSPERARALTGGEEDVCGFQELVGFHYPHAVGDEEQERAHREWLALSDESFEIQQRDRDDIWDMLKEYFWEWND